MSKNSSIGLLKESYDYMDLQLNLDIYVEILQELVENYLSKQNTSLKEKIERDKILQILEIFDDAQYDHHDLKAIVQNFEKYWKEYQNNWNEDDWQIYNYRRKFLEGKSNCFDIQDILNNKGINDMKELNLSTTIIRNDNEEIDMKVNEKFILKQTNSINQSKLNLSAISVKDKSNLYSKIKDNSINEINNLQMIDLKIEEEAKKEVIIVNTTKKSCMKCCILF